jgi:uncharacterized protein YprB with RNaseH-like and TPR domain
VNKGHKWDNQETYDAYHLTADDFLEKYPHINRDALRLKLKRDEKVNDIIQVNWCIGYWDLETSGLNARQNTVMVASVADNHGVRTLDRRRYNDERTFLSEVRDALESYDILVGWNSKGFDVGFLNQRLSMSGQRIMHLRRHVDAMVVAKNTGRFQSLSQENVGKALGIETSKTPFDKEIWAQALVGNDDAWSYILTHCDNDVTDLRKIFEVLRPQVRKING